MPHSFPGLLDAGQSVLLASSLGSRVTVLRGRSEAALPLAACWVASRAADLAAEGAPFVPRSGGGLSMEGRVRPPDPLVAVMVPSGGLEEEVAGQVLMVLEHLGRSVPGLSAVRGGRNARAEVLVSVAGRGSCEVSVFSWERADIGRTDSVAVVGAARTLNYSVGRMTEYGRFRFVRAAALGGRHVMLQVGREDAEEAFSPLIRKGLRELQVDYEELWV